MTLDGRFEYKRALVLTPERIKELETIFRKYCERVFYEATTVAETDISFVSVDELLNYDNFQNRKLKSLTVTGRNGIDRIVTCTFVPDNIKIFVGYGETCICRYTVSTVDAETTLKADILTFLKKVTASFWLIGKFRLFGLLGCVSLYIFPSLLLFGRVSDAEWSFSRFILSLLLGYGLVAIIRLVDRCVLEKLFPSIVFLWGEETEYYEKCDRMRKNIYWCVIVAIVVGIVVFYITNQLPK